MNKELKGQRYRNLDGREAYEIFEADSDFLDIIAGILQQQFGFAQQGDTWVGLDDVQMDFSNGEIGIVLGWDNWSGCFLHAREAAGDEIVVAMSTLLDELLNSQPGS